MSPIAFLLYNRPYAYFDAMPLSKKTNVAFIGWPNWNEQYEGVNEYDITSNFRKYFIDYNKYSANSYVEKSRKRKATRISSIVQESVPGSIVVIPRQKEGCVYLGRVKGFELFDNPKWLGMEEYTSMALIPGRSTKNTNKTHPAAIEVAQGWNVDRWEKVSLTVLPRWLQGKLNQQSVPCRLHGYDGIGDPYTIFDALMNESEDERVRRVRQLTVKASNDEEIQKRLLERIGPTDFEFLVRDLMICERPDLLWETGGKLADGGVDVAGFNKKTMQPEVLIQCKWKWNGENIHLATSSEGIKKYLFVLLHFEANKTSKLEKGITYKGGDAVVKLVKKHAESIPFLRSIGID